jgi:pyridoxamine 5'-phosphate oxidase
MPALPRPAPRDPLPLAEQWLDDAARDAGKNPWAMALATVGASGRPSVRFVLLKSLSTSGGFLVFFTNYGSRKAAELDTGRFAAASMYWPDSGRQLRFEGAVARSPAAESDDYFASRPRMSQLNAWASRQSRPLEDADQLARQLAAREAEFDGGPVPRPAGWGGYRLTIDTVEFWLEGADRFHERLRYRRDAGDGWSSAWLQP